MGRESNAPVVALVMPRTRPRTRPAALVGEAATAAAAPRIVMTDEVLRFEAIEVLAASHQRKWGAVPNFVQFYHNLGNHSAAKIEAVTASRQSANMCWKRRYGNHTGFLDRRLSNEY